MAVFPLNPDEINARLAPQRHGERRVFIDWVLRVPGVSGVNTRGGCTIAQCLLKGRLSAGAAYRHRAGSPAKTGSFRAYARLRSLIVKNILTLYPITKTLFGLDLCR